MALEQSWLATLHPAVSFQLIVYTNNKINEVIPYFFISLASTNALVHCNEFAAEQHKKKQTRVKIFLVKINHK